MTESPSRPEPHPIFSAAFARAYWITLRPYLFFISGASGAVGLAIYPNETTQNLVLAFAGFFFSYGLGQALTDVFQTDTDAISSPYRPLTQGIISKGQVLAVSLTGLGICAAVFVALNPWNVLFSGLGVAGLATYTYFKRRWWGGPFWNSWVVALLPFIGVLCSVPSLDAVVHDEATWAAAGSVFFSYAIFVLLGYFKDISADRATGYNTLPVVFGWRVSVYVSAAFLLLATLSSALFFREVATWNGLVIAPLTLSAVGLLLLALAHFAMLRTRDEQDAHRSIALVVRGYTLLHAGEASAAKPDFIIPAVLFCALFEVTLRARPEQRQI
jgi:4-hydroxybenzoate polyprenyltransferase